MTRDTLWTNIRKNKVSYLMLAPYMTLFILFTVAPVLISIGLSFTSFNLFEAPRGPHDS